ncbi:MAG: DUF542 domain-containing protein [Elusimicrobiota bacterium]
MSMELVLDVRAIKPRERHLLIFKTWESLPVGNAIKLINDHNPKPLYYQFCAERSGEFDWAPIEQGPERWSVLIKKTASNKRPALIRGEETVDEVARRHPAAHAILAKRGLDLCCGGAHPIAAAAQAKGVDGADLLAELNAAIGAAESSRAPQWMGRSPACTLDLRDDLRQGKEPFTRIMTAALEIRAGEILMLRTIFKPVPLYNALGGKGFEHWARQDGGGDWEVYFYKKN